MQQKANKIYWDNIGVEMINVIRKLSKLLNKGQKIKVAILFIMMLIGAFLETIGVSMIIPLVSAIMKPEELGENSYVIWICDVFHLESITSFVILLIFAMIFLYIFKNVFLLFQYYVQNRFVYNNRFRVQKRLLNDYLHRPYEYFLHASTGEIIRVLNSDVTHAFAALTTMLSFFMEAVVSAMLILTLFVVDFTITIMVAVLLGVLVLVIGVVIKPINKKAGIKLQKNNALSSKWTLQSIAGIKEIKVMQKEEYFNSQYYKYGIKAINAEKKFIVLSNVPRLLIEAGCISVMLLVIVIMIYNGRELTSMAPQLSAFAMAAVRLMPSINRLSTSYNTLFYQEPGLDKLLENLNMESIQREGNVLYKDENKKTEVIKIPLIKDKIELLHVSYSYPKTERRILEDVSIVIPAGKSVGIIGESGAGKTTVVDILLGLLELKEGQVLIDGIDIQKDYKGWLSQIAYVPQTIYLLDDTISNNIAFGYREEEISKEQIWNVLEDSKLADFVRELPEGVDTEIGERGVRLSGGQRQRIGIARALYHDPKIIIFDEATSALDNDTEAAIMESIQELQGKKTMIIIAHRLTTISECDIVYRVVDGRIVRDK